MSERTPAAGQGRTYPRDEFDDLQPVDGRRGAHRARANPALAMVPLLLVVVAVVAVLVGAMTLLGDDAPDVAAPAGNNGQPAAEQTTAAPEATAPPAEEPTDAATAPPAEPTTEPTTEPPPEPEPTVDTSVPVTVLNATTTKGLAAGAAEQLGGAGWTVAATGNYRDGPPPATTVYYATEDLAATAEAVAGDLGGAATQLSEAFGADGITVVLGEDYRP